VRSLRLTPIASVTSPRGNSNPALSHHTEDRARGALASANCAQFRSAAHLFRPLYGRLHGRPVGRRFCPAPNEEGFALPAFEAAACGTPVVTINVGPAADLLGPAACAFPPHDIAARTHGLRDLLRDPARRRAMSEAGRRRSRSFSWDRVSAWVHSIFREIGGL
jgi:glycosyltransferase involved in cell wall biosynthesis